VRSAEVVSGVLREARGADLVVLGGTEAGLLEHLLGYALPLEVADRTRKPVAIVYEMPAEPTRWLV
jgi:nucleotide-binding universal stress UspA family protein